MKKLMMLTIMMFSLSLGYSQETNIGKNQSTSFAEFCNDNALYVVDIVADKHAKIEFKGEIVISDDNNMSLTQLGLEILPEETQYFKIQGSERVLAVRSERDLRNRFQKH